MTLLTIILIATALVIGVPAIGKAMLNKRFKGEVKDRFTIPTGHRFYLEFSENLEFLPRQMGV